MREKTVCFSGHRPEKLPFDGDSSIPEVKMLMSKLFAEIDESIEKGYTIFISGVAKGVDIWSAKYIVEKKERNPNIKLICAVPYRNHGENWKGVDKWDLSWIFAKADEINYISENYHKLCMKMRNEYMVDNSAKLIAVVQDYKSGTGQTIRYAKKQNLEIKIIDTNKFLSL